MIGMPIKKTNIFCWNIFWSMVVEVTKMKTLKDKSKVRGDFWHDFR